MFPFVAAGQFGLAGPGYTNLTPVGAVSLPTGAATASGTIAGPLLPLTASRYVIAILLYQEQVGIGVPSAVTVNGVAMTNIIGNAADVSAQHNLLYIGIFVAAVGTQNNATNDGGYDVTVTSSSPLLKINQLQVMLWNVNMSSMVAHSTAHAFDASGTIHATLAITGVTVPANGFALLTGITFGSVNITAANQGFLVDTMSGLSCYLTQGASPFSGTVTATFGFGDNYGSAILASFAGDGS
jgi:hypothetical protein